MLPVRHLQPALRQQQLGRRHPLAQLVAAVAPALALAARLRHLLPLAAVPVEVEVQTVAAAWPSLVLGRWQVAGWLGSCSQCPSGELAARSCPLPQQWLQAGLTAQRAATTTARTAIMMMLTAPGMQRQWTTLA